MERNYGVNVFVMDSGERFCHVVDRLSGLPLYNPNLYLTTKVRPNCASSTVEAAASNLVAFLRFLDSYEIDLERRVHEKKFLREYELDALRDFFQYKFKYGTSKSLTTSITSVGHEAERKEIVQKNTQYSRLTTAAAYFKWLARYLLIDLSIQDRKHIDQIETQIKARRPKNKRRNMSLQDKALDVAQVEMLFEILRIGSDLNPFTAAVQRRNRLIILLLYHLGIRGGELLKIRISHIDFGKNTLHVVRSADDKLDLRKKEPNAKTQDRVLPMKDSLVKEIHDYVTKERRFVRNAKRHDFLFVTHKSGPTVGQAISLSAYQKIIAVVSVVAPQLFEVTGHRLRHTWNDVLSEHFDAMDEPPAYSGPS